MGLQHPMLLQLPMLLQQIMALALPMDLQQPLALQPLLANARGTHINAVERRNGLHESAAAHEHPHNAAGWRKIAHVAPFEAYKKRLCYLQGNVPYAQRIANAV